MQEHIVKPEELPLHCEGNIHDYEEALHGLMVLNATIIRSLEISSDVMAATRARQSGVGPAVYRQITLRGPMRISDEPPSVL